LATSAWRNNNKAFLNGESSILATVIAKEDYRHAQASIRHQHILLRQLLLLRADGLDQILNNFLVILLTVTKC
jgi:hypothetical protein